MNTSAQFSPLETERKFLLEREAAEALLATAVPHLALDVYDAERPLSYTRTTYLDTAELELFATQSAGYSRRLRFREYASAAEGNPPLLTGKCFLEYKAVSGTSRRKVRLEVPAAAKALLAQGQLDPDWMRQVATTEPFSGMSDLFLRVSPRVTTWYRRVSLSDPEKTLRLTMDEGIAYCPPRAGGHANEPAQPPTMLKAGPSRVIEVKTRGSLPAWLEQALAKLPETTEYSKFRAGMRAIMKTKLETLDVRKTAPLRIPTLDSTGEK